MTRRLALRWWPSPLALALATTSALALTLAVLDRRPELIAFTAPLIGALAGGWGWGRPPTHVELHVEQPTQRCFEQDRVPIDVRATAVGGTARFAVRALAPAGLEAAPGGVRAGSWGRFAVRVRITARAGGGLLVATAVSDVVEVRVYPRPAPLRTRIRPGEPLARLGVHIGRNRGVGHPEFAGIRPYLPGDPVINLNWLATSRLGRPHVTERLAARGADVLTVIDTTTPPGLDAAVHGATEVVRAALRRGDRAGVLALGGGAPRWLAPEPGRRQFYRIVDLVLDAKSPDATGAEIRVPRGLPPRSWVIVFSPLLDARIWPVIAGLYARRHAVVVVDVLRRPNRPPDPLIEQVWRFDREVLRRDLAGTRIPVLAWADGCGLDEVLAASPVSVPRRRNRENAPDPR